MTFEFWAVVKNDLYLADDVETNWTADKLFAAQYDSREAAQKDADETGGLVIRLKLERAD